MLLEGNTPRWTFRLHAPIQFFEECSKKGETKRIESV
jgi:hypothetical protein